MTSSEGLDPVATGSTGHRPAVARSRRAWLKPLLLFGLSVVIAWIVVGFVGAIDWGEVVDSFRRLSIASIVALLLGVVSLHDVPVVWGIVWNATAAFVAIIVISLP